MQMIFNISLKFFKPFLSCKKYAKFSGVRFGKGCIFYTKKFGSEPFMISIGDNCELSYNVDFITHDGAVWVIRNLYKEFKYIDILKPIVIGNNVFVGANSTILPGVVIGDNVIIASGSVVTKDISSNTIVGGVPAKFISTIDSYFEKNKVSFHFTKNLKFQEKKYYIQKYILNTE